LNLKSFMGEILIGAITELLSTVIDLSVTEVC